MRVLWVDPLNTNPHFVNLLSVVLREAGHEVRVCSVVRRGHPPPSDVDWTPFMRFRPPPTSLRRSTLKTIRAVTAYPFSWARAIRRARASGAKSLLVTTNLTLWQADTWAIRRLRRSGLRPVVIVHRPYQTVFDDPLGERAERYREFYESASGLLTMSDFVREWLQSRYRLPEARYRHLPHPHFQPFLDRFPGNEALARKLRAWAGGAPVIAFLSNMRPEQGLDVLLTALSRMEAAVPDWRLLLVSSGGSASQTAAAERRLADLGLGDRASCRWDAYSPSELKTYVEAASVVVTPYHQATQSGVLALAAGAGRPVVATEVGGLPEMVRPGLGGELVPARNPGALAEALAGVLGRLDHYREGARASRELLFSPRQAAAAVTAALEAAAAGEGGPGEATADS